MKSFRMSVKRKWSSILIAAGIALILFPWAREWYYDWQQKKLLEHTEQFMLTEGNGITEQLNTEYKRLQHVFDQESEAQEQQSGQESEQAQVQAATQAKADSDHQKLDDRSIAVIQIDKIDLKLPVLEGATTQNLKFAAAHMSETAPIGEVGNAAIAAHRARTPGRLFNRLNELTAGDEIVIQNKGATLHYVVYNTVVVEPTDLSVLHANKKDAILTLITCDPVVNATHRFIVQAKLKD